MTPRKRFQVKAGTIDDAAAQLPPLSPWQGFAEKDVDLFIAPRGFEPRACAFASDLSQRHEKIRGTILIGRYRTNTLDNDRRAEQLLPLLDEISTKAHVECDAETPSDIRNAICVALDGLPIGAPCHVVFDISASSSTFILSTLLTLMALDRPTKLTILYASAAVYFEPKAEDRGRPSIQWAEDHQREHGVSDVGTNELQPGIHHDHLPGFAISIPSMFGSRLQRCLGHLNLGPHDIDEQEVYWVLPETDSEIHKWRYDAVMQAVLEILYCGEAGAPTALPFGTFGHCNALDYTECTRLVLREIERHAGSNISMIHMGTKLQAVGVALALAARPEVSLVHARPQAFSAETYSEGIGGMWQVHFEDLHADVQRLARVGRLSIAAC